MRLIIAAIIGGFVMFSWGAASHMVLGLGDGGMRTTTNEAAVLTALKGNLSEPGLYAMPGMDLKTSPTEEQQAAWLEKYKAGPTAFLIYHPTGEEVFTPKQLGTELGSNVLAALLVGIVLSLAAVGFSRGVLISTMIGVAGWLSINVSYWNWYRFPTSFVTSELIDQTVGWFLSGLVLAFILKRRD